MHVNLLRPSSFYFSLTNSL